MPNFDGLNEITIRYTTTPAGLPTIAHTHTFDVALNETPSPGDAFGDLTVALKGGGSADLDTYILATYMPLIQAIHASTTEFQYAELNYIAEGTQDKLFISNELIADVGDSGSPAQPAQSSILTFKSLAGGLARLQWMETINASVVRDPFPLSSTAYNNIANHAISPVSAIVARDNSYLNTVIALSPGQNEALFKKRFRL